MIVGIIVELDGMVSSEYSRYVPPSSPFVCDGSQKPAYYIYIRKQSFTRDDKQPFDDHYYRLVFYLSQMEL